MPKKEFVELPSKRAWRTMKEIKDREIRHLNVSIGENKTVLDSPLNLNLRYIPRMFTGPFQAVGLVTSIFARMFNTRITLQVKDDEE